jgi:G6PDH family F420-dependent oxidoreductase
MATIGTFLSCEEHPANDLVRYAAEAEQAGFETAWISDHFHPWLHEQGQSPFVWCVLGGIAQATSSLRVHTAVVCPTVRLHPAIVAQAAATAATMLPGRFGLGVGSGEALNEHILGDPWPSAGVRLDMLEEAVAIIRALWTGEVVHHAGEHFVVDHARLYSLPDEPPPIHVSGFGPKATRLAAAIGDGYMNTSPDADMLRLYRSEGGEGTAHGGMKVCWGEDAAQARALAHRIWANEALPGELPQVLPDPEHFVQAVELVTEEMVGEAVPHGPDPQPYVEAIRAFLDAGYDEVYVQQIGPDQAGWLRFYEREVRPQLGV